MPDTRTAAGEGEVSPEKEMSERQLQLSGAETVAPAVAPAFAWKNQDGSPADPAPLETLEYPPGEASGLGG